MLLTSGYFPQNRAALIGVGMVGIATWVGWTKWTNRPAIHQAIREQEKENTARYLDSLLVIAMSEGASQVRLRAGIGIQVDSLVNGEWHELMRLPAFVWKTLRPLLIEKSRNWQRAIQFELNGDRFDFWPEFAREAEHPIETVLLTLRQAPPIPRATV
ncbi:hypothetical protein IAD21_04311 [Abditibacteriota bacterium]|nr:hypothetical protein IAD21_04311 [Abditibacteriota bacterium]